MRRFAGSARGRVAGAPARPDVPAGARLAAPGAGARAFAACRAGPAGLAVAGLIGLLPALPARAQEEPPLCRVRLELDPPRAFVGEQVQWRLHVRRRADVDGMEWGRPPSFPAFRAEWLPTRASAGTRREGGTSVRHEVERRALFPARAGRLVVPPAELVCTRGARRQKVEVPERALEVLPPPDAGRPDTFGGLVGSVRLSLSATPQRVRLGESVRVTLVMRGTAALWDASSPLPAALPAAEADVFPLRPRLARDAGERLVLRRYFAHDVVPRREGTLRIPPLHVIHFDPGEGRYRRAETPPVRIAVAPAAGQEAPPTEEAGAPPGASSRDAHPAWARRGGAALLVAALAALAALAAGLVLALLLPRRARRASGDGAGAAEETALLARAREAEAAGELRAAADALARALRSALRAARPDAASRPTEELRPLAEGEAQVLVRRLERLDRLRFAGEGLTAAALRALREEHEAWRRAGGPARLRREQARRGRP